VKVAQSLQGRGPGDQSLRRGTTIASSGCTTISLSYERGTAFSKGPSTNREDSLRYRRERKKKEGERGQPTCARPEEGALTLSVPEKERRALRI